ncbi:6-hydroxymethylpterin diphosphokinase MptE-like protein, partial [Poseidonibacter sp.]|uniref:6-hydroxymethylpterin diphosphokinase MptE-like protein n=1 Tax=Poseidonibacter sp. TaxID=2321188 RepID=UPI003C783FF3
MEEEIELNKIILTIYKKNLSFLKENFTDLYDDVITLGNNIDNGSHKEKYSLEFNNGYFDILNHENNGYFYNTNSYDDGDKRADVTTFDTKNSLDLLRKFGNTDYLLNSELYKDIAPIIDHLNEVVNFKTVEFRKIMKFVYIGVGVGAHLQSIDKKVKSLTTLIIEEELEIFRLSLFTTDYTVFEEDNRKLFLNVGTDRIKRLDSFNAFSEYHKYMNYNIKYNTLLATGSQIKEELIHYFAVNNVALFPYKLILENLEKLVTFIKTKERFLNTDLMNKKKILKNNKVLMISAGPSLDNYIEWISKNQNKFVIICVDVIVKKLELHKIVPDIIVSIDPSPLCAEYVTTKNPNYLDNSAFLFLSQQSKEIMEVVKNNKRYFSQVLSLIEEIGYIGSTPNVGTYAFELAIYLGANELFFIGNDAAFEQNTGNRYAQDSGYMQVDIIEENVSETQRVIDAIDVIKIKGNFKDFVKTNRDLSRFKDSYEEAIRIFRSYNV